MATGMAQPDEGKEVDVNPAAEEADKGTQPPAKRLKVDSSDSLEPSESHVALGPVTVPDLHTPSITTMRLPCPALTGIDHQAAMRAVLENLKLTGDDEVEPPSVSVLSGHPSFCFYDACMEHTHTAAAHNGARNP